MNVVVAIAVIVIVVVVCVWSPSQPFPIFRAFTFLVLQYLTAQDPYVRCTVLPLLGGVSSTESTQKGLAGTARANTCEGASAAESAAGTYRRGADGAAASSDASKGGLGSRCESSNSNRNNNNNNDDDETQASTEGLQQPQPADGGRLTQSAGAASAGNAEGAGGGTCSERAGILDAMAAVRAFTFSNYWGWLDQQKSQHNHAPARPHIY